MTSDICTLMYVDAAIVFFWLVVCQTFPQLGSIGSRTVNLSEMSHLSAQETSEALLSVAGVIDAVIIETEQVAYLKVDEATFTDENLKQVVAPEHQAGTERE